MKSAVSSAVSSVALVSALLFAPAIHAQSTGSDVDTTDETTELAPPSADDAGPPVVEAAPAAPSVYGPAYLEMARSMPFNDWEYRFQEVFRLYQSNLITLPQTKSELGLLSQAAHATGSQLRTLVPPPSMAGVHGLLINAADEYAAGYDASVQYMNGVDAARAVTNAHLARASQVASQARQALR